ncbi:MAG: PIN domain-containing protein [Chloroflexi bacterium]|nr:PIN domain-containing protein [Chloroflexota bacterium]
MRYLLDADWLISFLNGKANAVELVANLANGGIALSIITLGEVYEGLLGSSGKPRHSAKLDEFVDSVDLIAPTVHVAHQYANVRSRLRSQGIPIPDNDLWIAATALAHDIVLVSRDRHFERIPRLKLNQLS